MIEIGGIAPDFTLTSHLGDEVQLSSYKSQKNLVLSFHIYSFTGGWTHQVSSFRLNNKDFEDIDTQILGISCDSKPSQTAFSGSLGSIPYPLLSDFYPHGHVSKLYGVFNQEKGTPLRAIVIINKDGQVVFSKTYSSASDLDPKDILQEVKNLC